MTQILHTMNNFLERGSFFRKHKETILITTLGVIIMIALNYMMVLWKPELFTNPKYAAWSVFWNHGELSGFDTYTYIVVTSFHPVYVLSRHPILAMMLWPLYQLNTVLKDVFHINCAIYIVAVLWTILASCSWTLMYRILRKIIELPWHSSLLLTLFFFSFSHVMIILFFPDHMGISLPLLLLTLYLAGRSLKRNQRLSLWWSMPLVFIATGVTTTNLIKVGIADMFTQWGKIPFKKILLHFTLYVIPTMLLFVAYSYQMETSQKQESERRIKMVNAKIARDKVFAEKYKAEKRKQIERRKQQIIDNPIVTNTEYHIDRLPSLVENVFGEGLVLHDTYTLKDPNRGTHRPVLVRYGHWWCYAVEGLIVALFAIGIWVGRRQKFLWMVMSMFLFDMILHVCLNFASADVYIMTAHWAFVMPIAIGYLIKQNDKMSRISAVIVLCLTAVLWCHNLSLVAHYILG